MQKRHHGFSTVYLAVGVATLIALGIYYTKTIPQETAELLVPTNSRPKVIVEATKNKKIPFTTTTKEQVDEKIEKEPIVETMKPAVEESITPTEDDFEVVEKELSLLFGGGITVNKYYASKKMSVPSGTEAPADVSIEVYKNTPNTEIIWEEKAMMAGDSGRNISDEVKVWEDAKLGGQILKIPAAHYSTARARHVNVVNIGKRKYIMFDTSFAPAGTHSRNYVTYDASNSNLIYVSATIYDGKLPEDERVKEKQDEYGISEIIYPDPFYTTLQTVEAMLAK